MNIVPNLDSMTDEQKLAALESIQKSIAESKELQKQKIAANVDLVVQALKRIDSDIRSRFEDVGNAIEKRVASIKDGRDGINGKDGRDGKDGKSGKDGAVGPAGRDGIPGRDGVDGVNGVGVTSARIDFDGSLIISLDNGREINVGEVVAPDLAERIKVITNGGGTSQYVLDTLISLQNQINSIGGGLSYQGTWNATSNTPTLASSTGTNGYYYIVATAGSTNLNGITDWKIGDWLLFNGSVWQKIDQSWATAGANDNITSMTAITGGISSPDFIQFDTGATNTNAVGKLYWDASQETLTVGLTADIAADIGQTLYANVTNAESVTINKGQPVYMFGAQGDRMTVKLAYNTGDATSAKTVGVCAEDIAAGQDGLILCQGVQDGLNLGSYTAGDTLYLGATAGTLTATKPYAPNHLVYIGVVERANNGNGRLYVRVQNGYELDELHNVSAQSPSNGQTILWNGTTSLWEKANLTGTASQVTVTNGAGSVTLSLPSTINVNTSGSAASLSATLVATSGGTGQSSYAVGDLLYASTTTALSKLADVATGNALISGGVGVAPSWGKVGLATHVSGTLPTANGGTNLTSFTSGGVVYASSTSALTTGSALTFDGTNLSLSVGRSYSCINSSYGLGTPDSSGLQIFTSTGDSMRFGGRASGTFTEFARFDGSGNLLVGTTSTTSGGGVLQISNGITFPATQSASSNANTLDDYEEGTWTPTASNFTISGTSTLTGAYTKIGRVVYFNLSFANTGTIGYGASCLITLPFAGIELGGMVAMYLNSSSESQTSGKSGVQIYLDTANSRFFVGNFTTTSATQTLVFSGFYRVS